MAESWLGDANGSSHWSPAPVVPITQTGTSDTRPQTTTIVAVAGVSMVGSLCIIGSYMLWPDIRTRTRQFLVFLSLADFFNSAGNAAGAACAQWCVSGSMKTGTVNCQMQSFVTTYASLCSFAWTVSIAVFLYWIITSGDVTHAEKGIVSLHACSWGIPLAITLAAQFGDALGNDDSLDSSGWCWIRRNPGTPHFPPDPKALHNPMFEDRRARTFWLIMGGKGWEVLSYILLVVLYSAIKCHVYRETHHGRETLVTTSGLVTAQKVDRRLMFVPFVFITLRIWGTIRTMLDIADVNDHQESWFHNNTLRLLHGIGDNLTGFFNFVIFCCFSPKIRKKLFSACLGDSESRSSRRRRDDREPFLTSSEGTRSQRRTQLTASGRLSPIAKTPSDAMLASRLKSPISSARSSPYTESLNSNTSGTMVTSTPSQLTT